MSDHDNVNISQEEIERTARINMEVCAAFVARMIQKYGQEVLAERLRGYAEYRDLQIVGEYCDAGKSGKSIKGRPAFREMMDDTVNGIPMCWYSNYPDSEGSDAGSI